MDTDVFYRSLVDIAGQPPDVRYQQLAGLHTAVFTHYQAALKAITPRGAQQRVADGRTVAQVVGHIAEWERYSILSVGEVLAGVLWPGLMTHTRYVESDGTELPFRNNAAFNAHQAEKYAARPWEEIQTVAVDTATTCHRLWTQSGLLTPEGLERTRRWDHYELPIGVTLQLPCGWFLWMITIEHEGVEHVADLELGRAGGRRGSAGHSAGSAG